MQLLRMRLTHWRGVADREIEFSRAVTLIEGPNEIGKSSLVEALQLLFSQLDSSTAKPVKAIKPVDLDVGSRVEVELKIDDYQFVYAKTYNKGRATTLDFSAPHTKQLTGREAHELVAQILNERVDMALWNALLVDQSNPLALASLAESSSLAAALDAAAGTVASHADGESRESTAVEREDSSLFEAVQTEYEKYYTAKAGQKKFGDQINLVEALNEKFQASTQALSLVERDAAALEQRARDVELRSANLPKLLASLKQHERAWTEVGQLTTRHRAQEQVVAAAHKEVARVQDEQASRSQLMADVETGEEQLHEDAARDEPIQAQVAQLSELIEANQQQINELNAQRKRHTAAVAQKTHDRAHLKRLAARDLLSERLAALAQIDQLLQAQLALSTATNISDAVVEQYRTAEADLAIATTKRSTLASQITFNAQADIEVEVGGEKHLLARGEQLSERITSPRTLHVSGVLDVLITPSASVSEISDAVEEAARRIEELALTYAAKNLQEALAANTERAIAQVAVDKLKVEQRGLLAADTQVELTLALQRLDDQVDDYVKQRPIDQPLPKDVFIADQALDQATRSLQKLELELDALRETTLSNRAEFAEIDREFRVMQQARQVLLASVAEKRSRLAELRQKSSDSELANAVASCQSALSVAQAEFERISQQVTQSSPETTTQLMETSQQTVERAQTELAEAQRECAVLTDRLEQAQASGRFDEQEQLRAECEQATRALASTETQAAAAARLWTTLNATRDAAREAYVRPLKEAIEALGRIVYDTSFSIELSDDWKLMSRTLHGVRLPFVALSVGAREQLGIMLRLAAAQLTAPDGGVPLIIDDALGFSDADRLARMGAAVAAAGKRAQIIILTSSPDRFTYIGDAKVVQLRPD